MTPKTKLRKHKKNKPQTGRYHISDKEYVTRICKELLELKNKMTKNPTESGQKSRMDILLKKTHEQLISA